MCYRFKLKKAGAPTQFASFKEQPSWNDLVLQIARLFHISNVGVAFVDKRSVETIENEAELQKYFKEYPYDHGDIKFVVQDTTAPDDTITETWSKSSNLSELCESGGIEVKRPRTPDLNWEESKRSRIDTDDMLPSEAALELLHERLQQIDPDRGLYSDPHNRILFPFPFIGRQLPGDRFDFQESQFEYMGRKAFSDVSDVVNSLKIGGFSQVYIQGTMGYGKSHILAVLAGFLLRLGKRVVYLPDCRQLIRDGEDYMRTALLCAFANPGSLDVRYQIRALKSTENIIAFCKKHLDTYFIIDQMNALDLESINKDGVNNEEKLAARKFLNKLTFGQYRITSASANYMTAMHMERKQTGEKKLALMGGMSEDEMEQWWIHYDKKGPKLETNDKLKVEDLTGRIPLLLRPLLQFVAKPFHEIERKFWSFHDLAAVKKNVLQFAAEKRASESQNYEQFYLSTLFACLTASNVSAIPGVWFDFRYFYADEEGWGRCTCGLARQAAAVVIRQGSPGLLCGSTWIDSLRTFKNNPSVVGFMVEQACLSAISTTGFHHGSIGWQSFAATTFKGDILRAIPSSDKEIFFIPEDPFFRDIDALYLKVDAKEKKAWVVPFQVTVAKVHKDSEAAFYSRWSDWQEHFRGYQLKTNFVWVVEDKQSWEWKEEEFRTMRNSLKPISPEHEQIVVTVKDINLSLGEQLAAIR